MIISAITVTRDRPEELTRLIRSLLSQTKPIQRLYIVDNGGTQPLPDIADSRLQITKIRSELNLGCAGGFCLGIQTALRDSPSDVLLIDDDAFLHPSVVERMLKAREMLPKAENWVLTGIGIDPNTQQISPICKTEQGLPRPPSATYYSLNNIPPHCIVNGVFKNWGHFFWAVLLPIEVITQWGIPRPELFIRGDDYEYLLRLLRACRVGIVLDAWVYHHTSLVKDVYHQSLTGWKRYYQVRNSLLVNRTYFPSWKNTPLLRLAKYLVHACADLKAKRGLDPTLFWAYHDAVFHHFSRDVTHL